MPIMVPCPKCGSNLSAPDDAAGKRVRCPMFGCGAIAEVPGLLPVEEVSVVEATIAPPRSQRVEAIEDEDDRTRSKRSRRDEETHIDRPRRKKRRQMAGPSASLVIAIALVSILLVSGVGLGVYLLVNKGKDGTASNNSDGNGSGPKAPVPDGWVPHTSPGRFKAYFPKSPLVTTTTDSTRPGMPLNMVMTGGPRERLAVIVYAMPLPPQAADLDRDHISETIRLGILEKQGKTRVMSQRSLRWSGQPAKEMILESSNKKALVVYRYIVTDKCMYLAFFACSTGRSPAEENGFFDNFELLE